ncbi:MAG TPA: glycosyltransferase family 4 protein [bacterium]
MNLWVLNHYADTPDRQATRTFDLCRELAHRGHRTTIFASSFNHYTFREERLSGRTTWKSEEIDGVRVVWIKTHPYRKNDWHRVINMLSFAARAASTAWRLPERPDVIIGVTVHPFTPVAAYAVARLKHSRFCCEVTDLWPETLIQFGDLSPRSPVAWALRRLERFTFQRAERIFALWRHADRYFAGLGVPAAKVVWLPHGVPSTRFQGVPAYNGTSPDGFTIMYTGGLLRANALDLVLEVARELQSERAVRFVFVGDGSDRARLVEKAGAWRLGNVEFRGAVPKQQLAETMAEADAFILSLQDLPLYDYGISLNKLCDYLAAGRPILFAGRSSYNPVEDARAGFTVPPGDVQAMAAAIRAMMALSPQERAAMGRNARQYLREHHDIGVLADRLEQSLA